MLANLSPASSASLKLGARAERDHDHAGDAGGAPESCGSDRAGSVGQAGAEVCDL